MSAELASRSWKARSASRERGDNHETISHLLCDQILDLDAVARFDDLGDPLPVAVQVIALVAEDADRSGFLDQRRQFVEFFLGLRCLQMRRIDSVQRVELAA